MEKPKEKTTAKKSTKIAKQVRRIVKENVLKTREARAQGQPVAYMFISCFYDDILTAMDIVQQGTENYGGLCAAKMEAERFIAKAESEGFARHLCSYATCCLGFEAMRRELGDMPPNAPDGGMASPDVMVGVGFFGCDPRYKWFQAAQRYLDVPVHIHNLLSPMSYYSHAHGREMRDHYVRYIYEELKGLIDFLETTLGKRMDWDRLSEVVDISERTIKVWNDVHELRKAVPCPLPTEDICSCMVPGMFMMGTQEAYDFYCELYDEVKHRVDNKIGVIPDEKYRLLWSYSAPPWYAMLLFNYFESKGAVFAMEAVYQPPPVIDIPPSVTDPVERIARRVWATFGERRLEKARHCPTGAMTGWLLDLAEDYNCDGVVWHQVLTCRSVHANQYHQMNVFKENSDKPVLLLEGDIVDVRNYNEANTRTKIDTFIEVLDAYKSSH